VRGEGGSGENQGEKEWWEGDRRERENGEKQRGRERREDDMREMGGTSRGEKDVGGGRKMEGRMGNEGGGWGCEAGGEVAREEEREGGRLEGGEEVGRGGYKCWGRGGRRGRVMKRHPGKSPAARMYGLKYASFTTSIAR